MIRFSREASTLYICLICLVGAACVLTGNAIAQTPTITRVEHLSFDRPEAWALKRFSAASLLSGLPPPEGLLEERRTGSVIVGLEGGWLPKLSVEQQRVGFNGKKVEDLNKSPIFARPSVRIGLPAKFAVVAAAPVPIRAYGITPRLFAFGLERPIVERPRWSLGWRAYGQVGSVKGAFTCPRQALAFPAGSPENPSGCVAESKDVASLRYAGTEVQASYRISKIPGLTPHVAAGINFVDGVFQVDSLLATRLDRTRLWTHGKIYSASAGLSYLLTDRIGLTVDTFYSPLGVRRNPAGPRTNEGLLNVRALLSYSLRR